MALGDLHIFNGEEYVDTELAPLLNENFNSLKEYVDDASRWQVMPVQFKGTNAKFLIHETTLGTGTTQILPLVVLDNTDIAKFSACSLKVVMSTKNGSTAAVNCDISLQKVHNSNECNVNFNTTNSDDAKAEPCTFTYNNIKYAGLKLTTGNADTLWVSGYTTEEWIAPVVNTSVTNLVTLGSDMNVIPALFKSLQTDKSPVNDYDVVNKKSLNDLTNIKTYSQLSQIGLSGRVLDNSPYAIGNALPANSMLIVGISGESNTYNYPSLTGNLTVVRAHSNHVYYEITTESGNGYAVNYVLQFYIDTASEDTNYVWKRVLTDVDTGYWQPNETVTKGTVRKLVGKQYAGCFLVCKVAGTTGSTQPSPDPADGAGLGGGSGSITFYSSLEEIGITPGQETFASIHSALPINSVLEYYVSEAQNFADIYPASYGNFIATRLTGDITIFQFTGTNQIMYVTHYHVTNNTNPSWTQIAKQSDLTNLSNSVVKSVNGVTPTSGDVDINRKFYNSLAQLGLNYGTVTFDQIANKLPVNSTLTFYVDIVTSQPTYAPSLQIPVSGLVIVVKGASNTIPTLFYLNPIVKGYTSYTGQYTTYNDYGFSGWQPMVLSVNAIKPNINGNVTLPIDTYAPWQWTDGYTVIDGYTVKFPNGYKQCVWYLYFPSGYSAMNINFPKAFSAPPCVFGSIVVANDSTHLTANVYNVTATSCRCVTNNSGNTATYWVAMGYDS